MTKSKEWKDNKPEAMRRMIDFLGLYQPETREQALILIHDNTMCIAANFTMSEMENIVSEYQRRKQS